MTEENPFAAPDESSDAPSLTVMQQIAVLVVTFVATVAAFFATCFGSIIFGSAIPSGNLGDSGFAVILGLAMIIGLPLIVSGWVLTSVRRAMIKHYQNDRKPKGGSDAGGAI